MTFEFVSKQATDRFSDFLGSLSEGVKEGHSPFMDLLGSMKGECKHGCKGSVVVELFSPVKINGEIASHGF